MAAVGVGPGRTAWGVAVASAAPMPQAIKKIAMPGMKKIRCFLSSWVIAYPFSTPIFRRVVKRALFRTGFLERAKAEPPHKPTNIFPVQYIPSGNILGPK
jgi:hypothetical protein